MGNDKKITLVDGYRQVDEVELICAFKIPKYNEKYIIYSKNEKDKAGNTIIYSGKVITIDHKQFIENISDGDEWNRIKKVLKSMAKYSLEGENDV